LNRILLEELRVNIHSQSFTKTAVTLPCSQEPTTWLHAA
jgi:hypothetical protein